MKKPEKLTAEQKAAIYCVKHGHSRLMDYFFGYHYCARCGDQVGDSLGSVYSNSQAVYVHHMHCFFHDKAAFAEMRGCECPANVEKLTKQDFALVPERNSFGYRQGPPWDLLKKEEEAAG